METAYTPETRKGPTTACSQSQNNQARCTKGYIEKFSKSQAAPGPQPAASRTAPTLPPHAAAPARTHRAVTQAGGVRVGHSVGWLDQCILFACKTGSVLGQCQCPCDGRPGHAAAWGGCRPMPSAPGQPPTQKWCTTAPQCGCCALKDVARAQPPGACWAPLRRTQGSDT